MMFKTLPAATAVGLGLTLALHANPAGAAAHLASTSAPAEGRAITGYAAESHGSKTTLGAGYLTKPGLAHSMYSYFTIPRHCTADGYAFLGTVGFNSSSEYNTQALVNVACSHGRVTVQMQARDPHNGDYELAAANPGDTFETYIDEEDSETTIIVADETTGVELYMNEGVQAEIDNQFLTGSLQVSFDPLAGFGNVAFTGTGVDEQDLSQGNASAITQEKNGVVQAEPSALGKHHNRFRVGWKHS